MPNRIFCKHAAKASRTTKKSAATPAGESDVVIPAYALFCWRCQGSPFNSQDSFFLAEETFNFLRIFMGLPSRKEKTAGSMIPGHVGHNPLPLLERTILDGLRTALRLLAEAQSPEMICRFLLTMAVEIASDYDQAMGFAPQYDPARRYALEGRKTAPWWYLQREDENLAEELHKGGFSNLAWVRGVSGALHTVAKNVEIFHLKLLYLDFMVPLNPQMLLPPPVGNLSGVKDKVFIIE